MRRFSGLILAAGLWLTTAPAANAQVGVTVTTPFTSVGIGSPYGMYGSGYYPYGYGYPYTSLYSTYLGYGSNLYSGYGGYGGFSMPYSSYGTGLYAPYGGYSTRYWVPGASTYYSSGYAGVSPYATSYAYSYPSYGYSYGVYPSYGYYGYGPFVGGGLVGGILRGALGGFW